MGKLTDEELNKLLEEDSEEEKSVIMLNAEPNKDEFSIINEY